ncbi:uncharacterized protein LOC130827536 [Amaranthus tricolor]|uniref:uncharacterized protein LOC130827536 n=1 Tax=Amaranthus tricolor TaxID=29722 RepID=UPI00258C86C4|nr:uncharacterized protein LOC130827536 [Amaranthus tricolor]
MDSDGSGIATAVASRRLISQHSSLRDSLIAADVSDAINNEFINNSVTRTNTISPRRVSNITLGAVLNSDKKSQNPGNVVVRTLIEIISNNETISPKGTSNNKTTWKSFKERLKLKRNQNQSQQNQNPNSRRWISSLPVPQSDVIPDTRVSTIGLMMASRNSLRSNSHRRVDTAPADDLTLREVDSGGSPRSGGSFRLSAALAAEREQTRRRLSRELDEDRDEDDASEGSLGEDGDEDEDKDEDEDEVEIPGLRPPSGQPMQMSLMDLLEETDRQAGISGPTYRLDDEEEEEVEEAKEEDNDEDAGKEEFSCCVCMVRHKGAAFIPCGHTFCRLCSRELFVQRGNCPLCNNFILEILDIF